MIDKNSVLSVIDECEVLFRRCWGILCFLKEPRLSDTSHAKELVDFQSILATSLFKAQEILSLVKSTKKSFIAQKSSLDGDFFLKEVKTLSTYERALSDTMQLGKSLGDAYAWFFYHKNRELLLEHLRHEAVRGLPTGIGGFGEVSFAKGFRHLEGKFVLYHGITSILRHGDVSFIDLKKHKVVGIGELKSKKKGETEIELSICIIGPDLPNTFPFSSKPTTSKPEITIFNTGMKERFKRQLKATADAFRKSAANINKEEIENLDECYMDALGELVMQCNASTFIFSTAGNALILAGIRLPEMRLSLKLMHAADMDSYLSKLSGIKKYAINIVKKGSEFNTIILGTLDPKHFLVGTLPMFWWPLEIDVLEGIYFEDIIVATIFNPAHLMEALHSRGFDVLMCDQPPGFRISKKIGNRVMMLEHFDYFMSLIQSCLYSQDEVISIIENTISGILRRGIQELPGNTRVEMRIIQQPPIHFAQKKKI